MNPYDRSNMTYNDLMGLREDLKNKDFVFTAEINPPKGSDYSKALANAQKLKGLVSAINITDNSGAAMKMCPMALSHIIQKETGIEAIWQMTCRDRNRLALQSDLLGGFALGLVNLLPLRGDPPQGELKEEKCFDFGTEDLLKAISALEESGTNFCTGSAAHPGMPDLKTQRETMERRIGFGVEFFQTQICFKQNQLNKFVDSIGEDIAGKTLLGLTPLKSLKQAEFMNKNVWGVDVPESHLKAMQESFAGLDPDSNKAKQKQQECGLKLAKEFVDQVKTTPLKGIHLMAIGQETILGDIIKYIN